MGRERYPKQSLGALYSRIKQSRALLVGAGGIGCELLKNLVVTGFDEVHIIDLDTIDLSNLNRQFLFRFEHIKKPKALVAKDAAGRFNPNVKLEAYHANIKDPRFSVDWFQTFNLVFNALDNLDARRHVNKMCLAADVPLIESGTTGFNGQVQVIKKGQTECYDCNEKDVPKSYPVCTIRSTPSQPIHSIVWAKSYLLPEIFGAGEENTPDLDNTEDAENKEEIENLRREAQALKLIRDSMGSEIFAKKMFDKVFTEDITRLRSMEDMWKSRKPPEPLHFDDLQDKAKDVEVSISSNDQKVWTSAENFTVFVDSLGRLSKRLHDMQSETGSGATKPIISFDKDDVETLDFVTASANLRSAVFGIDTKSKFDVKQMAGNIIPAIATTNAMIAGLCVMQAFKVLRDDYQKAKTIFLDTTGARALNSDVPNPPNPACQVCGIAQSRVLVDPSRATLGDLVEGVLRMELGYGDDLTVNNEVGTVYDQDLDDNLGKKFDELGIKDESFLTIIDDSEKQPRINLQLSVSAKSLPEDSKPVILSTKPEISRRPKATTPETTITSNGTGLTNGVHDGTTGKKRGVEEAGLDDDRLTKREKAGAYQPNDDKIIVVDDVAEDGTILVD